MSNMNETFFRQIPRHSWT